MAAVVEPPGHRPILAVSAYLIDGKGIQPANRAILAKIGRSVEMQGADVPTLVGGDFQCGPADVDGSGFTTMIKGKVVAAPSGRGTFRTSRAATSIDFFVASDDLAGVVDEVKLIETSGVKGHTPVQTRFRPRAVALKALAVRPPPPSPSTASSAQYLRRPAGVRYNARRTQPSGQLGPITTIKTPAPRTGSTRPTASGARSPRSRWLTPRAVTPSSGAFADKRPS